MGDDDDVPPGFGLEPPPVQSGLDTTQELMLADIERTNARGDGPVYLVRILKLPNEGASAYPGADPDPIMTNAVPMANLDRQPGLFPLDAAQLRLLITRSAALQTVRVISDAGGAVGDVFSLWVLHPHLATAHDVPTELPPGLIPIMENPIVALRTGLHLSKSSSLATLALPPPGLTHDAPTGGASPPKPPATALQSAASRRPPRRLPTRGCDAWLRLAAVGQIPGIILPLNATDADIASVMGPPRTLAQEQELLKPGTVKAAVFGVLIGAGRTGRTIAEIIVTSQTSGLRDWSSVANPRNSIVNCCLQDPTFVRTGESRYALRCLYALPAWPPPPPRITNIGNGLAAAAAVLGGGSGDQSPETEGGGTPTARMLGAALALPHQPGAAFDVAAAVSDMTKCVRAERHARSHVASLQHKVDGANAALALARATAATAMSAAAAVAAAPDAALALAIARSTTPPPPRRVPSATAIASHMRVFEAPQFTGDPSDRKAVVAHKRVVDAAREAHTEAMEAAVAAERAAKRAKRGDASSGSKHVKVRGRDHGAQQHKDVRYMGSLPVQVPAPTQLADEAAAAVERARADVAALQAQLQEAASALKRAEDVTNAAKRALATAQIVTAQAAAATATAAAPVAADTGPAMEVEQPLPWGDAAPLTQVLPPPPPSAPPLPLLPAGLDSGSLFADSLFM